jgi:hypothetical protein
VGNVWQIVKMDQLGGQCRGVDAAYIGGISLNFTGATSTSLGLVWCG